MESWSNEDDIETWSWNPLTDTDTHEGTRTIRIPMSPHGLHR